MKAPLSRVPALPGAVGIVIGILLFGTGLQIAGAAIAIGVFIVCLCFDRHYAAYFAIMTAVGFMIAYAHRPVHIPESLLDSEQRIQAEVLSKTELEQTIRYTVDIHKIGRYETSPVKCQVTVYTVIDTIPVGSTFAATYCITPITSTAQLPHQDDYSKYLKASGILYTSSTPPKDIRILAPPSDFRRFVARCQASLYNAILDSPVSESTAVFLTSVITGDKSLLGQEVQSAFRTLGIAHVLALSGLHVGVLASLLTFMLFPLRFLRRGHLYKAIFLIFMIWLYALICGMGPSIVRASVMISVFTLAWFYQRGYAVYNSLLLSVIIVLMINPYSLYTPGFQLSFAAVFSIIVFSKIVPQGWRRRPWLYYIANMVVIPIAAMMGTGLISAYYFNTFPTLFLVSNIVTGLIFPWIFTGGFILAVFTLTGIKFTLLGICVDWLYQALLTSTQALAGYGGSEVRGLCFSAWVFIPYTALLTFLGLAIHTRRRYYLYLAVSMVCATAITITLTSESRPDHEFFITRSEAGTNIIFRKGDRVYLLPVTAHGDDLSEVKAVCENVYSGYMKAGNCPDTMLLVTDDMRDPPFAVNWPYMKAAGRTYYILTDDTIRARPSEKVDYVLIGKYYRCNIASIAGTLHPDTILLAADMHPKRRQKLKNEPTGTAIKDLFSE